MKDNFIIKLNESGYYKADSPYEPVEKCEASRMDRKQVDRIKRLIRRLGYNNSRIEDLSCQN